MLQLTEEKAMRLKQALEKTKEHQAEINKNHKSFHFAFKIKEGELSKENLQKILLSNIQARAGPKLTALEVKEILIQFNKKYEMLVKLLTTTKTLIKEGKEKNEIRGIVDDIYELIKTQISSETKEGKLKHVGIGAKITGVFMRNMVCIHKICPELISYLYQPIDIHVRNILVGKLKVFDEKEIPSSSSESFKTPKNQEFQKLLSEINTPRIEFDNFWCIGHFFCSNQAACHLCWINEYCQDPSFKGENLGL